MICASENLNSLELGFNELMWCFPYFSIGLDPDELDRKNDSCQNSTFTGLKDYVEKVLVKEEREHFLNKTIKIAANLARNLKTVKPAKGLSFSLQQQPNVVELEYDFVASLLANAFFSTFPNRTAKTHPTLQNFNFSFFFNGLPLRFGGRFHKKWILFLKRNHFSSLQRSKLKSILSYFEWISSDRSEENKEPVRLKISRKVRLLNLHKVGYFSEAGIFVKEML